MEVRAYPPDEHHGAWIIGMGCDDLRKLLVLAADEDPDMILAQVYANSYEVE